MLKNYLKIAFRNLIKQKVYALINVLGLAFGLACVILISLYISDEWSYDKFHKDAADIYRLEWHSDNSQTRTPHPMALAMKRDFPQVVEATSLTPLWGAGLTKRVFSIKNPEKDLVYDERDILGVDSTFFKVFDFKLIKGNKADVLRNVGGVLLSQSYAQKYFGDEDPIGKQLSIDDGKTLVMVEGVFEDVPSNSHFHFDILISYVTLKALEPGNKFYTWDDFGHFNYLKLKPGADAHELDEQLLAWFSKQVKLPDEDVARISKSNMHFQLTPLTDIHLKSHIRWELEPNGNVEYVYIMTTAAFLILLIASVNFMNISTAQSTERSKEIGVRKALGAYKSQVSLQFLGESLLTAAIAVIIAGLLAEVALPLFNYITGKQLETNYLHAPVYLFSMIGIGALVGLLAGLYPALFLSSINTMVSLKGIEKIKPKGVGLRNMLVVLQFLISMVLISGSFIINDQLYFLENKDLGYDKNRILNIPLKTADLDNRFLALKTELEAVSGVQSVSGVSNVPGLQFNQHNIYPVGSPKNSINISELYTDESVISTMGLTLLDGRGFSRGILTDRDNALIINEKAANELGLSDPVGKEVMWEQVTGEAPRRHAIIGVVKDFNYQSLHETVKPLVFKYAEHYNYMLVKISNDDYQTTLNDMAQVWSQFIDRFNFEYTVLSDDLSYQYQSEEQTAKIFSGFSIIAVFIACCGLFGLASLSFKRRMKEVGVRKVLGASVFSVLSLLLKDFSRLIIIAILIAAPFAWYLADNWLHNFTYKVEVNPLIFVLSGMALIIISWITLSYLTLKAAKANPVDVLKDE